MSSIAGSMLYLFNILFHCFLLMYVIVVAVGFMFYYPNVPRKKTLSRYLNDVSACVSSRVEEEEEYNFNYQIE